MAEELTAEQQLEAAKTRIAELESQLKIEPSLEDTLKQLSTEELTVTVGDALMAHLGHHPKLWAYWQILRDRIMPPPPASETTGDASSSS